MTKIRIFGFLITAVLVSSCGARDSGPATGAVEAPDAAGDGPRRPNIILVMADDMGWGDTGYSGSTLAKTPNLDAMAAAGTTFSRFYSAAPVCSPTRGSLVTGRHPYRYGIYFANVGHLPAEEVTIAEVLKDAGYRTGFFGKWHLGTLTKDILDSNRGGRPELVENYSPPWMHGFDTVFATESKTPTFDPMIKPKDVNRETWWDVVAEGEEAESFGAHYFDERGEIISDNLDGDDTKVIVDRLIPFIEKSTAEEVPFFAIVWTHAPHLPVVASKEDQGLVDSTDPYTRHYFGSIHALDTQIGRIRAALSEAGESENTLLWFTSDNGPETAYDGAPGSSGGLRGAKRSLYEGGIRVPAIIEWPDQIEGSKATDVAAVTSDIYPTILDYLDIEIPSAHELDGESIRPVLSGESAERNTGIGFESNSQIAYIEDNFKIIHQPAVASASPTLQGQSEDGKEPWGQNNGEALHFELYDLRQDPQESNDLSNVEAEKLSAMKFELNRWRKSVAASIVHYKKSQASEDAQ